MDLLGRVSRVFGLGELDSADSLSGASNLVWSIRTEVGRFVVKELPIEHRDRLLVAVDFERAVFESGTFAMPEPCPTTNGHFVPAVMGSRGRLVNVRVHRHIDGYTPSRPVEVGTVRRAGSLMAALHTIKVRDDRSEPNGVRIWRAPDQYLFVSFVDRWSDAEAVAAEAWETLRHAERLVGEWAARRPAVQLAHCDHKPENSLVDASNLWVLDWDEASVCDPRVEAVEAALRSSWTIQGPDPERVAVFVDGYRSTGLPFPPLTDLDWAKWVAGISGWFEFQARSSLGGWATVAPTGRGVADAALDTIGHLAETLDRLDARTRRINAAL